MTLIWALSRYVLPVIAVIILVKCIMTLMLGHPKEKIYGYIVDMITDKKYELNMWETSVGRSNSCDVVLPYDSVARSHAVITRRIDGWYIHDLLTRANLSVNGEKVVDKTTIKNNDIIVFGKNRFRFVIADDPVVPVGKKRKRNQNAPAPVQSQKNHISQSGQDFNLDASLRKRTQTPSQKPPQPSQNSNYNSYYTPVPSYTPDKTSYTVETASRPKTPQRTSFSKPTIINRDTGERFTLCGNEVSIGSARKSDIRLHDASVEGNHALIILYEDGWAIDKFKGKTYLNGTLVKSPQLLFNGDVISVGEERLYFQS